MSTPENRNYDFDTVKTQEESEYLAASTKFYQENFSATNKEMDEFRTAMLEKVNATLNNSKEQESILSEQVGEQMEWELRDMFANKILFNQVNNLMAV